MRKGLIGLFFGGIVFFMGLSILFNSPEILSFSLIFPFVFIIIFILILVRFIKYSNNNQSSGQHYYDDKEYYGKDNLVSCVECHKLIDKDFKYCPDCGASQKNTIVCEYCGHENPKSNALCEKCNGFL